ncbi:MAG: acyltransferase [Rhizobiaceae bacterium]|nr:acyltransferase [Rhizobiaceae bacterium]
MKQKDCDPHTNLHRLAGFAARERNNFNAVRLAAAISVVVSHAFVVVGGQGALEPLQAFTGWSLGAHAVHVFFVLSGFMIAASWERATSWLDFSVARALRIMPALICVNILIVLIAGLLITSAEPTTFWSSENIGAFLVRATLLFSVGVTLDGVFTENPMGSSVNIPIWTIRFEVICYLTIMAFMTVVAASRLRGLTRLAAVAPVLAVSGLIVSLAGHPDQFSFAAQLARFVFAFYLGVACWIARHYIPVRAPLALFFTALAAAAAWSEWPLRYPVMIIAAGYLSFWVGSVQMGRLQRWTTRTDLSYGVYITGFFIQQWLVYAWPPMSVWQNALIGTAIALAVAWLSWTYVEKPALGLRHMLKVKHEPAPETGLQPAE